MEPTSFRQSIDESLRETTAEIAKTRARKKRVHEISESIPDYQFRLGRHPISLSQVEFRIIRFLAEHPYRAFTRTQIVAAVSTQSVPVSERSLDEHIQNLRGKLGMFSDYIQSVPHIGYRFKP